MYEKTTNTANRERIAICPKTPLPLRHPPAVIHQIVHYFRKLPALFIAALSLIRYYFNALASKIRKRLNKSGN